MSSGSQGNRWSWQDWLWLLLPAFLAVACYANSLGGDFVWDDRRLILDDRAITSWDRLHEIFGYDFFYRSEDDLPYGYYRPLVTLTYLVDYSLWQLNPLGYHLTNVLLHAGCSTLVALVTVELGWSWPVALIAASLFAAHPIHTENVAWIAGRTDVLALLWGLVALAALLVADRRRQSGLGYGSLTLMAAIAFAAAILAKEMSVVVVGWSVLALRILRRRRWQEILQALWPLLAIFVGYAVLRFGVLAIDVPGQKNGPGITAVLLSAPHTVVRYLLWMLWPHPLSAYVQNPYATSLVDLRPWLSTAALAAAALAIAYTGNRRLWLISAFLVCSFLPVLNLVRLAGPADMGAVMAERFCYFPSFPFCVAIAGLLTTLGGAVASARRELATLAMSSVVVAGMAAATIHRNPNWRDELTFLRTTLEASPDAALLWSNLAQYHLRSHQLPEAERAIAQVERLKAGSYSALATRTSYYVISERWQEAIPLQEQIVANATRGQAAARNNLAFLYRQTGEIDRALALLEGLVAADAAYADVYFNLAAIHRQRGELEQAQRELRLALEDRPNSRSIATELASVEVERGDFAAAEAIYLRMLALYPGDARLMNNLALVQYRRGNTDQALALWKRAMEADPRYETAQSNYRQALKELGR